MSEACDVATDEGDERNRRRECERGAGPPARQQLVSVLVQAPGAVAEARLLEPGRQLGHRPGREQQVVGAPQALPLLGGHVLADQFVEVGLAGQFSSSSASASLLSALRVRVLTVPSGMFRKSAISDCESPLQ